MAERKRPSAKAPRRRREITLYTRSVVCGLCQVSERELSQWEAEELILPARIIEHDGDVEPLYDLATMERIRLIQLLAEELEVNVPGIGIILRLLDQLER